MDDVMQDRGEKIVTLAREILRNDHVPSTSATAAHITMSFKVLCLATVLTAAGSSALTELIIETRRPLNRYERTELDALVFYTARLKGLSENELRHDVLEKLKVSSFDAMTEHDFTTARSYLQTKAD